MKNFIKTSCLILSALAITLGFSSCEGDSDSFDNGGDGNQEELVLNAPCKYKITLLDTEFEQDAVSGTRDCTLASTGGNDPNTGINSRIPAAGLIDMEMGYGMTISRGTVTFDASQSSTADDAEFADLFKAGDYSFSMGAEQGFEIIFIDDDGTEWSSSNPDNLASSNWLKINDSVSGERSGEFSVTIQADFSCSVTNADGEGRGCSGNFTMTFANQ